MSPEWAVFLKLETWVWLGGGLLITLRIAAFVVCISFVTGVLTALARVSRFALLRFLATVYVDGVRSVPVFVLLIFTYFGFARLGFEFTVSTSVSVALTIYATAVISEIVRAGINAVPRGQKEAALSLAMSPLLIFVRITFPQAFRVIVPPLVGQYIILIKETSLGAVIGLDELMRRTIILYNGFQNPAEALVVAAVIYFLFLSILTAIGRRLEIRNVEQAEAH